MIRIIAYVCCGSMLLSALVTAAEAKKPNICWSAQHCNGKKLNNKDRHNCKNSGGKSWQANAASQCVSPP